MEGGGGLANSRHISIFTYVAEIGFNTYDVKIRGLESQVRFKYMYSFSSSLENTFISELGNCCRFCHVVDERC